MAHSVMGTRTKSARLDNRRVGLVSMSEAFLRHILRLPAEHGIIFIRENTDSRPRRFDVLIEGPLMPEVPGDMPAPEVEFAYKSDGDGRVELVEVCLRGQGQAIRDPLPETTDASQNEDR